MNRTARALALSAAATALFPGPGLSQDFIETIAAQAPLENAEQSEQCEKAAAAQLAEPLADLRKRCQDASGQFNVGNVTPSIHRRSCSVYQTVTCSATDAPASASQQQPEAKAAPDGGAPAVPAEPPALKAGKPEKPAKPEPKKRTRRKPKLGERHVQTGGEAAKAK